MDEQEDDDEDAQEDEENDERNEEHDDAMDDDEDEDVLVSLGVTGSVAFDFGDGLRFGVIRQFHREQSLSFSPSIVVATTTIVSIEPLPSDYGYDSYLIPAH